MEAGVWESLRNPASVILLPPVADGTNTNTL